MLPSHTPGHSAPRLEAPARARLTRFLKEEALRVGFAAAGVARLDRPELRADEAARRYRDWLERGDHGELGYMARLASERSHPRALWPEARSLLAVAWSYYRPDEPDGARGRFARYARGRDYHRAVASRLRALARRAESLVPGLVTRAAVDTGPVLERAWAEIAGLGFTGKHSGLIRKEAGNYFLIGELLVNLELDPDPPAERRCGSCERCITACPTGAITGPYRVDARRCVSYLTIELRGAIPRELRPLLGERIFGCDDCLDACPWNRFARAARETEVRARPGLLETPLESWLSLDDEGFRRTFTGSAVLRARRGGFLRNVAVALGNRRDPASARTLGGALEDSDPLVRAHAAWALGRLGTGEARAFLTAARAGERETEVRAEIDAALAGVP